MITKRGYDKIKKASRKRQAALSLEGRDIGAIPSPAKVRRRGRCKADLQAFLKTYFPDVFYSKWSRNHIHVINKLETAILHGGQFALAMPRGTGKTSMSCFAALWAILYGYRKYVVIVGATDDKAIEIMNKIKMSLETNPLITADFPEVCFPVAKLEGIVQRSKGQLAGGQRTYIDWRDDRLVMPTIKGSVASGAIFESVSITSANIRGKSHLTASGKMLRPDFCIIDDPQTPESAANQEQCRKRGKIIKADVLRMAGPGKKMTAVMTCTVIEKGDLCDEFLDTEKHPEWNGERMRFMDALPSDMDLWDQYRVIWGKSQREHAGSIKDATEFYRQNQQAMDAGALPTWPERFEPNEISAVQCAMNILIADRKTFYSEFQNDPIVDTDETDQLTTDLLSTKLNGLARCMVPLGCDSLTMYIDIHDNLLFWVILAYGEGFTGAIIDYGTWPRQKTEQFTLDDARYTMPTEYKNMGRSARIYAALNDLTALCLSIEYHREDNAVLKIDRCHIDANWGPETPVVYRFCRQSQWANILTPCHGRGITAAQNPISARKTVKGERAGLEWYLSNKGGRNAVRFCAYDANWWKTFVSQRLKTSIGDPGCLSIFGDKPYVHDLFFGHICAEFFTPTSGRGRRVDVWQQRAQRPDNHWLDCVVGATVAASVGGISIAEMKPAAPKKKKNIPLPAYIPQI
jgi:hypothetical protein